jgi:hypothetical protein
MQLQVFDGLRDSNPDEAKKAYDAATQLVRQAHSEARRLISEVRPPVIDEDGLETASGPSILSNQELDNIRKNLDPQVAVGCREKRTSERLAYSMVASVAPYSHEGLPTQEMFLEVRCHDISAGGVSFFLPIPPNFQFAIVALGRSPDIIYIMVRVTHCTPHDDVRKEYLVGCHFLERVQGLF